MTIARIPNLCTCTGRAGFHQVGDDYVCASCDLPRPGYEEQTVGLAFFRGGPVDGRAYTYTTLRSLEGLHIPIMEYKWTPEKITSQSTGKTARVWIWVGPSAEGPSIGQETGQPSERKQKMQNTTTDGVTNTQLLERRNALKLSRPTVAAKAGITVSQLANMEVSGKRVKEGVMDKVHEALSHFEREAGSTSEPSDKEDHTPAEA